MNGQKSGQQSEVGSGGQAGVEKRERRNPEQIIANLREIDEDLGAGFTIEAIAGMMRPPRRLGAPDGAGDFWRAARLASPRRVFDTAGKLRGRQAGGAAVWYAVGACGAVDGQSGWLGAAKW